MSSLEFAKRITKIIKSMNMELVVYNYEYEFTITVKSIFEKVLLKKVLR